MKTSWLHNGGLAHLWPDKLRVGPLAPGAFRSRVRDERTAAILGVALGIAFSVCFSTGVLSHLIQQPPGWFEWPARPASAFRVTQGLHVATGIASIPLLLAKLWTVYPRLFTWPPVSDAAHGVERAGLLVLVGGALFMLFSGVANIALWYPWRFFFPAGHYWGAWVTMGGLVAHIGAKIALTRAVLRKDAQPALIGPAAPLEDPPSAAPAGSVPGGPGGLDRRGFLTTVAAGAGVLTLTTVGQTLAPLRRLAVLAPRRPGTGPQGLPVNKTARGAAVTETAVDPAYRLVVRGDVTRELSLSREDLATMAQKEVHLPIACVEGWSASAAWRGVPVADLLAAAGVKGPVEVRVESLQPRGRFRKSILNPSHAGDGDTLLALELNGEPLHIDHGYPVRLIGPNGPGVLQTKWVSELVVKRI